MLGALAMILSLAFDPLIQNLVHYPIRGWSTNDTSNAPAWIGRTRDFIITDERVDPRSMFFQPANAFILVLTETQWVVSIFTRKGVL